MRADTLDNAIGNIAAESESIARFCGMLQRGEYPATSDALRDVARAGSKIATMAQTLAGLIENSVDTEV